MPSPSQPTAWSSPTTMDFRVTVLISWLVTVWPQSMNLLVWLLIAGGLAAVGFVRQRRGPAA